MRRIVREFEFPQNVQAEIDRLSARLKIQPITASILYARGADSEEKMQRFLHPSKENFLSPFLMQGMKEAVELLSSAKEENLRVAIFGDYDADGIGASAILARALKLYGIEPFVYVPEREDGYGLSVEAIDSIFDEFLPDLFVTVDCGVSNEREVEYIQSLGADVIVTDHHELPEKLPPCIVINPKLNDDYPYDNLCGAGVAFKLATALLGERAEELLDICALSTVADSVPLLGENRDIVAEGLERLKKYPRLSIVSLIEKQGEITAQTLAYTVAPRVNAAGRMGDAGAALKLFLSDDEDEILSLSKKLSEYNARRQALCDELYEKAKKQIAQEGAFDDAVMLVGEDWHPGLIGIAAARLSEEFMRPALLFVKKGDMLRGSARSIETVNIFEAIKACSEYLFEYGGHSQAAGISVKAENFASFKEALNRYLKEHYTRADFEPTLSVCGKIEGEFPKDLARELSLLEPYGVGNKRPLFLSHAKRMNAGLLKPPHASASLNMDFVYFGGAKDLKLLKSDVEKELVFECNLSKFRGKETVKGFVRAVVCDGVGESSELDAFETLVKTLPEGLGEKKFRSLSFEETKKLIDSRLERSAYGLCVVAQRRESIEKFSLSDLSKDVYRLSSGSVRNVLLFAPERGTDFSAYRDVVFLEEPYSLPYHFGKANLFANEKKISFSFDLSRASMAEVFSALYALDGKPVPESFAECAFLPPFAGMGAERTIFALSVFEELSLFSLSEGRLFLARGKKTELIRSRIYRRAQELSFTE